jgi:phosphomevalonate kinase
MQIPSFVNQKVGRLINKKRTAVFKDFFMPDNFTLMYGRGDGSNDSILNDLIKKCDKRSTEILKSLEKDGFYEDENIRIPIEQIPNLKR